MGALRFRLPGMDIDILGEELGVLLLKGDGA